jgi:large subunit ribosomal protein L21
MYAVVTTGGKQFRVEAGTELVVERLAVEPGASITFDRVLLLGDGESVTVGTPTVDGASVSGTVIGEARGPKLIVFKFKQKVKYRRTAGHRQHLTRVRIDEISSGGRGESSRSAKADEAQADETKTTKADETKADAAATAEAPAKPARAPRTRKPATAKGAAAAKTDGDAAAEKPAPRRRTTAKKAAEAEE